MRIILHSDINNCYASIECLYHPEYKHVPMAVGGDPEKRHGVILAKNMPAKALGIRTGETLADAKKKCPFLVILPPRHHLYAEYCDAVADIYAQYTDQVEAFGPDERWLDVTGSEKLFGDGQTIADEIRSRVRREIGLTVSIGVSYNKIYAKIGSDLKKPDATTVIRPEDRERLIYPLGVDNLLFVGRSTLKKLQSRGIYSIGDLAAAEERMIQLLLGKNGESLRRAARGEDRSEVRLLGDDGTLKSIGNSTTPLRDMKTEQDVRLIFEDLAKQVAARLAKHRLLCRGLQIHVRRSTLETAERQCRLPLPTRLGSDLSREAVRLFSSNFQFDTPYRSIGLRAIDLTEDSAPMQITMALDPEKQEKKQRLEQTMQTLNDKYGKNTLSTARTLSDKSLLDNDQPDDRIPPFLSH